MLILATFTNHVLTYIFMDDVTKDLNYLEVRIHGLHDERIKSTAGLTKVIMHT